MGSNTVTVTSLRLAAKGSTALLAIAMLVSGCGGAPQESATAVVPADTAPAAESPAAAPAPAVRAGAAIRGVVSYAGRDPDVPLPIEGDPFCAVNQGLLSETVTGDGAGHLGNVVVYVKSGPIGDRFPAPAEPALLDQRGCQYHPHVLAIRAGQPLRIRNSDATLHNIHAQGEANPAFNVGEPFAGMELARTFDRQEVAIPLRCSVHPWMLAWVAVFEHPFFAVSADDGSFEIAGLPPGTYTLEAWHETLGTRSAEATVGAEGVTEVSFPFAAPGQ
jgi:plastocyanin